MFIKEYRRPGLESRANRISEVSPDSVKFRLDRRRSLIKLCKEHWDPFAKHVISKRLEDDIFKQLDIGNIIDTSMPRSMAYFGLKPGEKSYKVSDVREKMGYVDMSYEPMSDSILSNFRKEWIEDGYSLSSEERMVDMLLDSQLKVRQHEWEWRIGEENDICDQLGYYTLFGTLTIDPKLYDPEELLKGPAWHRFRQSMKEEIRKAGKYTRKVPVSHYFKAVSVVEHGSSGSHHHIHCIMWVRNLPDTVVDPNRGRYRPNAFDIPQFSSLWEYGYARVGMLFYTNCRAIREGWIVPVSRGKSIYLRPARDCGRYLMKYMTKGDKRWRHRIRATRRLGLTRLDALLRKQKMTDLYLLSRRPARYDTMVKMRLVTSIPSSLLKQRALLQILHRVMVMSSRRRVRHLLKAYVIRKDMKVFSRMRESVLNGARPWQMRLKQRYEWLTGLFPSDMIVSSDSKYLRAVQSLSGQYRSFESKGYSALSIDNVVIG